MGDGQGIADPDRVADRQKRECRACLCPFLQSIAKLALLNSTPISDQHTLHYHSRRSTIFSSQISKIVDLSSDVSPGGCSCRRFCQRRQRSRRKCLPLPAEDWGAHKASLL